MAHLTAGTHWLRNVRDGGSHATWRQSVPGQARRERSNQINIGALEYVVIGVPDDPFTQVILPELHALQGAGHLSSNGAIASGCRRR
jgi:hypothetical protein